MAEQHAPEPWHWEKIGYRANQQLCSGEALVLDVGAHACDDAWIEIRDEDARRVVACVNACAGIPTEDLEAWAESDALPKYIALLPKLSEGCCPAHAGGACERCAELGRVDHAVYKSKREARRKT